MQIINIDSKTSVFIWSDQHANHKNILRYSNRPFQTIEEMNIALLRSLETLTNGSILFDLGDVSFGNYETVERYFKLYINKLKNVGVQNLYICLGNHDKHLSTIIFQNYNEIMKNNQYECFVKIDNYYEVVHCKQNYVLCHYPIESWNGQNHGSIMLHGHCHNNLSHRMDIIKNRYDVGVDSTKLYRPVNILEFPKNDKTKV